MKFPSTFYRWRPHPWHGLEVGPNPPRIVHAYIEITPFDLVKYEMDRLWRYFETYKMVTGQKANLYIEKVYKRDYALEVVKASIEDYELEYGS